MYNDFLNNASKVINEKHSINEKIVSKLSPFKNKKISAENLVEKVKKAELNFSISGVDSGFVSKKLSFLDLVLVRTAGVIFTFRKSELEKAQYYPKAFSFPEPFLLKAGLEKDEEQQSVSLRRLRQEVSTSVEIIKKFKPKYIFVDGSIVPQYQDKPRDESKVHSDYISILKLFELFYETAEENNCTIISCVEDSRGTRFRQLLEEKIFCENNNARNLLEDSFDIALLDALLLEGERTCSFTYTKKISSHAILKDLNEKWASKISAFYIKPSNLDKPLRVEFISKDSKELIDEIASIVYTLSSLHKEYSYPSVLIEADLRAGLNEQDISVVYDRLVDKLGPKIRMRRNSRPFK